MVCQMQRRLHALQAVEFCGRAAIAREQASGVQPYAAILKGILPSSVWKHPDKSRMYAPFLF